MVKKIASYFPLIFIIFGYLFVVFLYRNFVPLWDGWETLELWLLKAVSQPFNLLNFDNGGHPSMVYFLILSLGQYLDYGNMKLLYITNAILYSLAIICFWGLLKKVFYKVEANKDILILTFMFAFYPITLAQTFQPMPDFGVFIFYVIFLYSLLSQKRFIAVLSGIGLLFSKEYGLLLYLLTLFFDFIFVMLTKKINFSNLINYFKSKVIFIFPFILLVIRTILITRHFRGKGVWLGVDPSNPVLYNISFSPEVVARIPWSYFVVIFIINFNWILSLFMFFGAIYIIWNRNRGNTRILFIFCLFIGSTFILTLFKTFSNPRYFMALYPLMIILFYFGLVSLIRKKIIRDAILTFVALLFFLTNFLTLDPISKKLYGTFKFGKHEMLKMTSITRECCGYGRDQLVYNLEYMQFHFILNKIQADIKPNEGTIIVYHPLEGEYIVSNINKKSYERSFDPKGSLNLFQFVRNYWYMPNTYQPNNIIYPFQDLKMKPEMIYFIEFSNMDNIGSLQMFAKYYLIKEVKIYENWGYEIPVYSMEKKI